MTEAVKPIEAPNTVHGRLLESVHISGYSFERACSELEWLLDEDRWKQVGEGFKDINAFLGTIDFSEFRIAVDQRKKLAARLKSLEASQRSTAKVLGVAHTTIERDLKGGTSVPPEPAATAEPAAAEDSGGTSVPPAWFQSDVDPAELAKKKAKADEKQSQRAEEREKYAASKETGCTVDDLGVLAASGSRFNVIYADPPWEFKVYSGKGKQRSAERHYDTKGLHDIKALPVEALAADDCALFLWCVMPELLGALAVIEAWGFTYKTAGFTWVKQNKSGQGLFTGMGYWTRANAELCLFATRGEPKRHAMDVPQVLLAPVAEHSRKPAEIRTRIERLLLGPYLELYGREPVAGWTVWGNQIERSEFVEDLGEVA